MYKYRIDDETSSKVMLMAKDNSKTKIDKLINELSEYDKVFDVNSSVPDNKVNYERMEDVVIDSDAIKEESENELYTYKKQSIDSINDSTDTKIQQLEEDKQKMKNNYDTAKEEVKNYYSEAKENASQDALRRGLSRSSIVINTLDAFDKGQIEKYNELNDSLTASINEIDTTISSLRTAQNDALKDFDIEYAVKLQEKINQKTKELENKQNEVLKYNNEIAEKENEYNEKYSEHIKDLQESNWDKEKDMMDFAGKYGVNMISNYIDTRKYNTAIEYLDSMDKSDAVYQLNNNETLRNLLGESNIAKLLNKYNK